MLSQLDRQFQRLSSPGIILKSALAKTSPESFLSFEHHRIRKKLSTLTAVMQKEAPQTGFDASELYFKATQIAGRVVSDIPQVIPLTDTVLGNMDADFLLMNHYWRQQSIPGGLYFRHGLIRYPDAVQPRNSHPLDLYVPILGLDPAVFEFLIKRDGSSNDALRANVFSAIKLFYKLSSHDWFHNICYNPNPGPYDFLKAGSLQEALEEEVFLPLRHSMCIDSFSEYKETMSKYESLSCLIANIVQEEIYGEHPNLERSLKNRFGAALEALVLLAEQDADFSYDQKMDFRVFENIAWIISTQAARIFDELDCAVIMHRTLYQTPLQSRLRDFIHDSIDGCFHPVTRSALLQSKSNRNEALHFVGKYYYAVRDLLRPDLMSLAS